MIQIPTLGQVLDKYHTLIAHYVGQMLEIHNTNLISIVLYGSGLTPDFRAGKSNINLLLIFNQIDPPDLDKSVTLVRYGLKKGIVPLMLTKEHIDSSLDTFPTEFIEIKDNHLILYGEDTLSTLEIKPVNLRLESETILKGNLIRLYQIYLEQHQKDWQIWVTLNKVLSTLFPTLRNLLRLKDIVPLPKTKIEVLDRLSQEYVISTEPFKIVLTWKYGLRNKFNGRKIYGEFVELVEQLSKIIDTL